jgi:hypothetical protein
MSAPPPGALNEFRLLLALASFFLRPRLLPRRFYLRLLLWREFRPQPGLAISLIYDFRIFSPVRAPFFPQSLIGTVPLTLYRLPFIGRVGSTPRSFRQGGSLSRPFDGPLAGRLTMKSTELLLAAQY